VKTYTKGMIVYIKDGNGALIKGRVLGYGGANDGTGRRGWFVETMDGREVYWRAKVRRVSGQDTHA